MSVAVNPIKLADVLRQQRNAYADEAAVLAAQCMELDQQLSEARAELEKLRAAQPPAEKTA